MHSPICLVCGSGNINFELSSVDPRNPGNKVKYDYLRCGNCRSVFLKPGILGRDYYKKSYGKSYYVVKKGIKNYLESVFSIYTNYLKRKVIGKFTSDHTEASIIDVGSGNLNFLKSLGSYKYDRYSIDIKPAIEKEKGITTLKGDFNTHDFEGKKFDIATAWHVIEHIPDPLKFLKKLNIVLKSGGYAILSTPNIYSLGYKLAGKYWYHLDAPRHMVLFNETSLRDVSRKMGFEVVEVINPILEFPFDLLKSLFLSGKWAFLTIYPILKFLSRETVFLVLKKK